MTQMDWPDFETILREPEAALRLARSICARHGWDAAGCAPVAGGARLAFATGERFIKIYPAEEAEYHANEAMFLRNLGGKLPVETPALEFCEEYAGFPYLVMRLLPGEPLANVWPGLSHAERLTAVDDMARATRALHALPVERFSAAAFHGERVLAEQYARLEAHHRASGLAEGWVAQVRAFVDAAGLDWRDPAGQAPLHTELMLDHFFAQRAGDGWRVSGLIDFEPGMVGPRLYDLCAVGVFITQGEEGLFRRFVAGCGLAPDARLTRQVMALLLLHRYSNLPWFLSRVPGAERFGGLDALAEFWFGV